MILRPNQTTELKMNLQNLLSSLTQNAKNETSNSTAPHTNPANPIESLSSMTPAGLARGFAADLEQQTDQGMAN